MTRKNNIGQYEKPAGGGKDSTTQKRGTPLAGLDEHERSKRLIRADRYWDLDPKHRYPTKYAETGLTEDLSEEVQQLLKENEESLRKYGMSTLPPHKADSV